MELNYSGFAQHFVRNGAPFVPRIYSGSGELPEGFNAALVRLDASEHSPLKWQLDFDYPLILWELDFALDRSLLEDEARLMALEIGVEHFSSAVWPNFQEQTLGVVLYRGPLIDLQPIEWLASRLPQEVRPFVLLDTDSMPDAHSYFRGFNQAIFGSLTPILRGKWAEKYSYAIPALAWEHANSPLGTLSEQPLEPVLEKRLERALYLPEEGDFPLPEGDFRVIPEVLLTHEWDGVEELIVDPSSVSVRGRRKLSGFTAAGGEIIYASSRSRLLIQA